MKKWSLVLMLFVGFLVLSGCGQKKESKIITFWNPLTGEDGAYMDRMVKKYNQTNPEYKVKPIVTSDMYTKIYTVMRAKKDIPDLAIIHADRVPGFVNAHMLKPLTNVMANQPELKSSNYLPQAWKAGNIKGTQYTVPLDIHSSAMYYNKDLLKKYGVESFLDDNVVTFDEMMSLQHKLKKGDYVVNNSLLPWVILAQIINFGGDIQDSKGRPSLNTTAMRQSLEAIKKLADAKLMTPNGEDGYLMFQSGNVLFSTDGTWSSTAHDIVKGLNYGVTNIYSNSPAHITNRASSHMFALLNNPERTTKKEKAIGKFIEYMRTDSLEWAKAGQIVASKQVVEEPAFKKYKQSFFTSSQKELNSLHIFTYVYYPYVEEAITTYGFDIVYGNISIEQGMKTMQKYVEDKVSEVSS